MRYFLAEHQQGDMFDGVTVPVVIPVAVSENAEDLARIICGQAGFTFKHEIEISIKLLEQWMKCDCESRSFVENTGHMLRCRIHKMACELGLA